MRVGGFKAAFEQVIAVMAHLIHALAAVFCGLRLKAAVFDESSPFNATLEELAKDRERLLP